MEVENLDSIVDGIKVLAVVFKSTRPPPPSQYLTELFRWDGLHHQPLMGA